MSPARRSIKRRDWPRGLTERRPGYFTFKHPDGRELVIGRVSLAVAKSEAIAANQYIADEKPGLVERLSGAAHTVSQALDQIEPAKAANSVRSNKSLDKRIRQAIGKIPVGLLTVKDCAEVIEAAKAEGKMRTAQATRSRMVTMCRRAMQLGWIDHNPAEVTGEPKVEVKRGRLTLELFKAIYAKAGEVAEWLPLAMKLALLTGADRSTISGLQRSDHASGYLTITRTKTGARIAIPTALRLDCMGWTLADVLAERTGVVSRYIVHHVNPYINAPVGSAVHVNALSRKFTEARVLAGIPDIGPDGKGAPTLHEVRSLAKRLYEEQGGVDTKALLGHATERMSDLYSNPRGAEAIKVRVK